MRIKHTRLWLSMLMLALGSGCTQRDSPPASTEGAPEETAFKLLAVGEPAPVYDFVTPGGDTLSLSPQQPVTLLNLWAPWCSPCIKEFPELERLHQELGPKGLRIVAVDVDPDAPAIVTRFAADLGVTFSVALDPGRQVEAVYQAMALPSSYLMDKDGHLLARWTGTLPPAAYPIIDAALLESYAGSP